MSGIYIPGINLPRAEDDWTLELFVDSNGEVEAHTVTGIRTLKAIEFPPHGRLIDADALSECDLFDLFWQEYGYSHTIIDDAPTILPADKEETA